MKKILLLLTLFVSINVFGQAIVKFKDQPTTVTGTTSDYLLKDDAAGIAGSTHKITVANFISAYGLMTSANTFNLFGNTGSPAYFLGYTDASILKIRTNNVERMRIDASGVVTVGASFALPTNRLFGVHGRSYLDDTLQLRYGSFGANKVLTSDASGNGSWSNPIQISTSYTFASTTTYTVAAGTVLVLNTNTATVTGDTLDLTTLTASAVNGQIFSVSTVGTVTTLGMRGATIYGKIATMSVAVAASWFYSTALTAWIRRQ